MKFNSTRNEIYHTHRTCNKTGLSALICSTRQIIHDDLKWDVARNLAF